MPPVLLPGEHVEVRLRPSPWAFAARYARGVATMGVGAAIWALVRSPSWTGHDPGPAWQFWSHLYGNAATAHAIAAAMLVAGGVLSALARRRPWRAGALAGGVVAACVLAVSAVAGWQVYGVALPVAIAMAGLVLVALAEADRLAHAVLLTNLRVIATSGLRGRQARHVRYQDIADIDTRQGPWGRVVGCGDLVPVLRPHAKDIEAPVLLGIRPVRAGYDLLAAMVQRATASPALQDASGVDARLAGSKKRLGLA